jgi:hypothetical protein
MSRTYYFQFRRRYYSDNHSQSKLYLVVNIRIIHNYMTTVKTTHNLFFFESQEIFWQFRRLFAIKWGFAK